MARGIKKLFPPKLEKAHPPPENEKRDTNKTRWALNCPIVFSECSVMNAQKKENKTFFFSTINFCFVFQGNPRCCCVSLSSCLLLTLRLVYSASTPASSSFLEAQNPNTKWLSGRRARITNERNYRRAIGRLNCIQNHSRIFFLFLNFLTRWHIRIPRSVMQLFSRPWL